MAEGHAIGEPQAGSGDRARSYLEGTYGALLVDRASRRPELWGFVFMALLGGVVFLATAVLLLYMFVRRVVPRTAFARYAEPRSAQLANRDGLAKRVVELERDGVDIDCIGFHMPGPGRRWEQPLPLRRPKIRIWRGMSRLLPHW